VKRFLSSVNLLPALLILLITTQSFGYQEVELPELNTRVTDLTGTLHANEIDHIAIKLASLEKIKGSQLVVVVIPTTGDETIEQYGIRLAEKQKIGRDKIDDGVLLIVAKKDRKVRIEVGYGLEGAIPDAYSKRIIEEIIVPQFQSGDFYHGIDQGVDAITSLINGEKLPMPHEDELHPTAAKGLSKYLTIIFPFAFILLTVINYFAKKKLGRKKGAFITPILLFLAGWWFINVIGGLLVAVFSLIFLNIPGGRLGVGKYRGGRYYGSTGSYNIGGGSAFGGGGGGSFGGGGASGSW
jgi:uncharacterized protein